MDYNVLAPWRDLALIWFVLLTMAVVAVPGAGFYFAVKGVRWVKRKIRNPILQGQMWAARIQRGTTQATDKIAEVPIGIASSSVRVTTTARGIFDFLIGR